MKNRTHMSMVVAAFGVALGIAACAQPEKAPAPKRPAAHVTPSPETPKSDQGGTKIAPAGSVAEIWSRIAREQDKLSAVIDSGDLEDVHHIAFAIRDLVVTLADKAGAASPALAPQLKGLVEQVRASATKLDERGDAGDLSGTQAEFATLRTTLSAIKAAIGAS